MTLQEIGITISAYDHSGQALGKITSYFSKLKKEISGAWAEGHKLTAVMKGLSSAGNMALGGGAALGAGLGFRQMAEDAGQAEHSLAALGNIANMSQGELAKVRKDLLGMSSRTNQSQAELLGGLTALMGRGMGKSEAMQVLEAIGKTSTATGASVEDLAKTVFTATSTMKMPLNQVGQLFDSLAQAGKEGSFELKDMAKSMPELAAKAANLGMSGHKGMVQLAAWGQIAKMGTDDPAIAANNLANFLDKVTGKEAVANFAKHGIDLRAATSQAWASGDFIGTMLQIIQRDTKGDTFKLNELFGDVQVKNFLAPALQHLGEYRKIAADSMGAKGVVGKDYDRMMGTFMEKAKKLKIQMAEAFVPKFGPWMDRAGKLFDVLNRHPKLFGAAINTAVGIFGVGAVLKLGSATIGTLQGVGAAAGKAHSLFTRFASSNDLMRNAMVKGIPWIRNLTLATWGTTKAFAAQAAAWAMTPFGMITIGIIAVATGAILLWRNWDKVTAWFKSAWNWFQGLWAKVPGWARWLLPMVQIPMLIIGNWAKIKGFFGGLWTFISGMAKRFWEAGKNIAKAIWEGIKSAAMLPVEAVKGIVTRIRRFLPFSPAKEGPLRDIHRVRLVETIAEGIKPAALIGKMAQVARVMVPTLALAIPGAGASRSGITVNLTVHVQGTAQDGRKLAQEMMPEIIRQFEIYQDRQAYRSHR